MLGHELAHVVQRQPGTPTVFRTPAAPEYHGVTGKHDPARVKIDPIATFVPSVHLPAATVNVAITATHSTPTAEPPVELSGTAVPPQTCGQ